MSGKSDDTTELEQARKAYWESVAHATRFTVSGLVVLVLLGFVVDLEIRDFRKELDGLQNARTRFFKQSNATRTELRARHPKLQNELAALESGDDLVVELPSPSHPIDDEGSRTNGTEKLQRLVETLKVRPIVDEDQGSDDEKQRTPEEKKRRKDEQAKKRRGLIRAVEGYRDYFLKLIAQNEEFVRVEKELQGLERRRGSVPTPFGSFEIRPGVALLLTTIASFSTYFAFLIGLARIRWIAIEYGALAGNLNQDPIYRSATHWLNPFEVGNPGPVDSSRRWRAWAHSAVVHAAWVSLISWLAWESLYRWNVTESVEIGTPGLWWAAILLGTLLTWVLAILFLTPAHIVTRARQHKVVKGVLAYPLTRRNALRLAVVGIVTLAVGRGGLALYRAQSRQRRPPLLGTELGDTLDAGEWFGHAESSTLHHREVCKNHLPTARHRVAIDERVREWRVHPGFEARILENLAEHADPERRVALYDLAIQHEPLSIRLYDGKLRALRKLGQLERVEPMFQTAIASLEQQKGHDDSATTRALDGLRERLGRTRKRDRS